MADCNPIDLVCKARNGITGAATGVVEGAFEQMCRAFADAGAAVLQTVADAFLTSSTVDLRQAGIEGVMLVTTSIGMGIALLLLLGQVIRTGLTMRGDHLAHGLIGVFKAALATACVVSVATLLLVVADELSAMIMEQTFGSTQAFSDRFATAVTFSALGPTGPAAPVALLLIFGLLAVIVGVILFGEMLFRHAAIVVLIALSPIAASGLVAGGSADWWRKLVTAGVQLIFLKPLIVLVFAIGFGVAGESGDVLGLLAGLVTLVLAAVAWPALAKLCTWTGGHVAEAGGLTAIAAGMVGARAAQMPGRMMSPQAQGSAFDSDRATIARNSAAIDAGLAAGGSRPLVGAGVGGAGAAAGPVGTGVAVAGQSAGAARDQLRGGFDAMTAQAGLGGPPHPPGPPAPRRPPDSGPTNPEGDR